MTNELIELAVKGEYIYLYHPTAKEGITLNLIYNLANPLNQQGMVTIWLNARTLSIPRKSTFYHHLIRHLTTNTTTFTPEQLKEWFSKHKHHSPEKKLTIYLKEVLLEQIKKPVIIVISNVQAICLHPYADDFFSLIRSYYNNRPNDPKWQNLSFILQGTIPASQLIKSNQTTPYNIGYHLTLEASKEPEPELGPESQNINKKQKKLYFGFWTFMQILILTLVVISLIELTQNRGYNTSLTSTYLEPLKTLIKFTLSLATVAFLIRQLPIILKK